MVTSHRIQKSIDAGFDTVGSIAEISNDELLSILTLGIIG